MANQAHDGGKAFWNKLSQEAYDEVEERFPVAQAEKTHTFPDGRVVNMDREAMMARLYGFRDKLVGVVGEGK